MRILLLILLYLPFIGFGQCVSGDCENGYGTYTFRDGGKYVGQWKDDKKHGQGFEMRSMSNEYVPGLKRIGNWENGIQTGKFTTIWIDGIIEVGQRILVLDYMKIEELHSWEPASGMSFAGDDRVTRGVKVNMDDGEFRTYYNYHIDFINGYRAIDYNFEDLEKKRSEIDLLLDAELVGIANYKMGEKHGLQQFFIGTRQSRKVDMYYEYDELVWEKCWDKEGNEIDCE